MSEVSNKRRRQAASTVKAESLPLNSLAVTGGLGRAEGQGEPQGAPGKSPRENGELCRSDPDSGFRDFVFPDVVYGERGKWMGPGTA